MQSIQALVRTDITLTVWAQHIKSIPARPRGTAYFWIGVGASYFIFTMLFNTNLGKLSRKSLKEPMGAISSEPGPLHSTGIASYALNLIPTDPCLPKSSLSSFSTGKLYACCLCFLFFSHTVQKYSVSRSIFLIVESSCKLRRKAFRSDSEVGIF